jgi:hypothetical protein
MASAGSRYANRFYIYSGDPQRRFSLDAETRENRDSWVRHLNRVIDKVLCTHGWLADASTRLDTKTKSVAEAAIGPQKLHIRAQSDAILAMLTASPRTPDKKSGGLKVDGKEQKHAPMGPGSGLKTVRDLASLRCRFTGDVSCVVPLV